MDRPAIAAIDGVEIKTAQAPLSVVILMDAAIRNAPTVAAQRVWNVDEYLAEITASAPGAVTRQESSG